ncbi:hypothetical protein H5410_004932, partial [Solanum commersonii]
LDLARPRPFHGSLVLRNHNLLRRRIEREIEKNPVYTVTPFVWASVLDVSAWNLKIVPEASSEDSAPKGSTSPFVLVHGDLKEEDQIGGKNFAKQYNIAQWSRTQRCFRHAQKAMNQMMGKSPSQSAIPTNLNEWSTAE